MKFPIDKREAQQVLDALVETNRMGVARRLKVFFNIMFNKDKIADSKFWGPYFNDDYSDNQNNGYRKRHS